jgi:hypothetical protein
MLKNSIVILVFALILTSCSAKQEVSISAAEALLKEVELLPENTSYSLLSYLLHNAVKANKIGGISKVGGVWKFKDSGTSTGRLDHTLEIKTNEAVYTVILDGSVVSPANDLDLFSKEKMEGIDQLDNYIQERTKSSVAGEIIYQPSYSSMEEVNSLLINRVDHQNSFNLGKAEMERLIVTLLSSKYTIDKFAALGESDYYLAIHSGQRNVVLYYSGSRLLIGGFIFNDREGLLL